MNIKQGYKKAIEGGWKLKKARRKKIYEDEKCFYTIQTRYFLLDPHFWKCLGKAMEWEEKRFYPYDAVHSTGEEMPEAKWRMLNFVQNLWDGQLLEEAFNNATK